MGKRAPSQSPRHGAPPGNGQSAWLGPRHGMTPHDWGRVGVWRAERQLQEEIAFGSRGDPAEGAGLSEEGKEGFCI